MTQISDGFVDILRAAQIAPRGFAKVIMGGLESYRGTNKHVDDLLRHKTDVLRVVDTYTGDGKFQSSLHADAKSLKLTVRLTGKSLSEVVPLGGFVPVGAAFLLLSRDAAPTPPMLMPQKSAPATPPTPARPAARVNRSGPPTRP
jgi:hypothetical protein